MAKKFLFIVMMLAIVSMLASCGHQHEWSEWQTSKEATCITEGVETRTCKCAKSETRSLVAKGHTYGEWIIESEATCTANGSKRMVCSDCETNISATIFQKGHAWTSATCLSPSICSICSSTRGSTGDHNFVSGKCSYCGASDVILTNTYEYSGRQYVSYYWKFPTRTEIEGAGYIEEFTYDGNYLKVVVTIGKSGTFGFNYKITDSNGITVASSYMMKMNTYVGEKYILEAYLKLSPGKYKITFSSHDALS